MGYNLEIAFIGYNSRQTRDRFVDFVLANRDDIEDFGGMSTDPYVIFKNGTIVMPIISKPINYVGKHIDQIILVDDIRENIYRERENDINFIRQFCMKDSCVPDEFQVMYTN